MKFWTSLLCIGLAYATNHYGELHFYKNVGKVFYDYSGRGYHAINGASIGPNAHGVKTTDRGAYFDGVAAYLTLHNSPWGVASFVSDWSCMGWVYPMKTGPFLSRYRVSENPSALSFRIDYIDGSNLSTEFYACESGSCQYETYTSTHNLHVLSELALQWRYWQLASVHLRTSRGGRTVWPRPLG